MASYTTSQSNTTEGISLAATNALMLVQNFGGAVVLTYGVDDSGCCLCRESIDCGTPGKHPVGRGGYHNATTNISSIRSADPSFNWSLCTGDSYVGLDDDTDDASGIDLVEAEIGIKLPDTATIRTVNNHRTRLFRSAQKLPRLVPMLKTEHGNVDFIASPGMVVLPGSRAKNDRGLVGVYSWESYPLNVGIADLPVGVAQMVTTRAEQLTQNSADEHRVINTENSCVNRQFCVNDVERLIRRCIPDQFGMRWHCLFRLARGARGLPQFADVTQEELEPLLREWHRRSLPNIRTKEVEASRRDLWEAYKRVKFPGGTSGRLAAMVDSDFGMEPLPIRVERLCADLQASAGDEPFFLACRAGAEVLGTNHVSVSLVLKDLVRTGALQLVQKGKRRKASEYRYRGGDE